MKKIGLIVLSLVLALGLVGAAFALWTSTATVSASVTMGTVYVGVASLDSGTPTGTNYGSGWYSGVKEAVTNAYPGEQTTWAIEIENLGTLPVKLDASGLSYSGNYNAIFGSSEISLSSNDSSWSSAATFTDLTQLDNFLAAFGTLTPGQVVDVYARLVLNPAMDQSAQGTSGTYGFNIVGTENP